MRDAMADLGGDPAKINPLVPAELVIDHSVQVDAFGTRDAFRINAEREFERNQERYAFLRWGQDAFEGFTVVPPDTGIVHQVNLEYLARVVFTSDETGARRPGAGLPRHAGRDRLAHDDDQRPRRARLGRRRHRGRGGDARPADVDADPARGRLQAARRAARGRDRHRPRAHRHPDAARARRRRRSSSSSTAPASRTCRWPTAPRSATCRPSSARPARSSRSTPRRCATSSSPGARRSASSSSRPTPASRACGTTRTPRSRPTPRRWSSTSARSCPSLAGPKRPQDRVSLTESKAAFRLALEDLLPDEEDDGDRRGRGERRVLPGLRPARHQRHARPRAQPCPRGAGGGTGGAAGRRPRRGVRAGHARRRHARPSSTTATS